MKTRQTFFRRTITGVLLLLLAGDAMAQPACTFSTGYPNVAGWTMNGVGYTIGPTVFSFNATPCNAYNFATIPLGCTLDDFWCAEIDFRYNGRDRFGVAHSLLSLKADTGNSWNVGPGFATSNNDMIEAYIDCLPNAAAGAEMIYGISKDGTTWGAATAGVAVNVGNTYYLRLERLSATDGLLSVFTNAARTIHAPGSPQCFPIAPTVQGLRFLQHGCMPQGFGPRKLSGTLDNFTITSPVWNGITGLPASACAGGTYQVCIPWICSAVSYNWTTTGSATIINGQGSNCAGVTIGNGPGGTITCSPVIPLMPCPLSYTISFTVLPSPVANAGTSFNTCCGALNYLGQGSATATGGTPGYTYSWSPGTNLSCTNCPTPGVFYCGAASVPITYTLTVTDTNGCTGTSTVQITYNSCRLNGHNGAQEQAGSAPAIAPNPAQGNFTVTFGAESAYDLEVVNVLGEVVYSKTGVTEQTLSLDLTNQPKGVYLVKCREGEHVFVERVILQ